MRFHGKKGLNKKNRKRKMERFAPFGTKGSKMCKRNCNRGIKSYLFEINYALLILEKSRRYEKTF